MVLSKTTLFRFHARELDLTELLPKQLQWFTEKEIRQRAEAAKQEAESQTNKRRTKFPRDQVQEVRRLATILTTD